MSGLEPPRVFVAGSTGMVGSALVRRLRQGPYEVLTGPVPRVDLRDQKAAQCLLADLRPDWVVLAAAKVGGIRANIDFPADFIYDNLAIQTNVIHGSYLAGVKKLLFLGSSCIYPRLAPQPMKEECLLSGYLEPTNEPYAIAKIAGIVMARSYNRQYGTQYISVIPTNLYGPNDTFDLSGSHVIPALILKTHQAKIAGADSVDVWGSGNPRREFLHVDDVADACAFLMEQHDGEEIINVGSGVDMAIRDLASLVAEVVGFEGGMRFNATQPDGTPRKLLDVSRMTGLGWKPSISLREGLASTYRWFLENQNRPRK